VIESAIVSLIVDLVEKRLQVVRLAQDASENAAVSVSVDSPASTCDGVGIRQMTIAGPMPDDCAESAK
jgi:hypothetical protein